MPLSASEVADRWAKAMSASTGKMKAGILAMTKSPAEAAIKAKDKYREGILRSLEDGTWEAGLRSVVFADWQKKTADVGTTRVSAGVQSATPAMTKFFEQLLPYTDGVKRQIDQMPDATPEDRIQRMVANARLMAQFKPRK